MTEKNASDSALDDEFLKHFLKPRNTGVLADADLKVRAENPVCGDLLDLHLRRDERERVEACTFQVYGCPAAIAVGSVLTEVIIGKSRAELNNFDRADITALLGELPHQQFHAVELAHDAVRAVCSAWAASETDA